MDKKLLDALNNLSIGLEFLVEALNDKNKGTKSAVESALKSQNLDKKFTLLSKSIENLTNVNKSIIDGQNTTLKLLEDQSKKIENMQSSVKSSQIKSTNISEEIASSGPIEQEIQLKYAQPPNLPELARIDDQVIGLKYGEVPTLPEMARIEEQVIGLKYGEIPTLPELARIDDQVIPLKYGEIPTLPEMARIEEQVIGLKYSEVPTLPELARIEERVIPLKYGDVNLPQLTKIEERVIPLKYDQVPTLPELARIEEQVIGLNYGEVPILPELAKVEQIINLNYGQVPTLPELDKVEQIINLNYGQVPTLPELAKVEQTINLNYGQVPTLPKLSKAEQIINLNYGQVPTLPELSKFEDQVIGLRYGEIPTIPELAQTEQIIPIKYGEVPTLPELTKFEDQVIGLKYGEVPTLPELAKISEQEVPIKYGPMPLLDIQDELGEQEIPLKWGEVPTLPQIASIPEQIIPMRWGSVPNPPNIPDPNPVTVGVKYENVGKFKAPKPDKVLIPTEYEKPKNKAVISKPPPRTIDEQGKKNPFGEAIDNKEKQGIKDGVSMIMMIAVAVLAIGMAFKLIGGVNVAAVLSLAIAIPMLALAFSEVSKNKELTAKRAVELIGVMVAMATALLLTSLILQGVAPIGLVQVVSAIAVAGIFTVLSFGISQLVDSVQGLGKNAIRSIFLLPIIMPAISLSILLSSYILSAVAPIGVTQIVSSLAIAGVFFVLGHGIKSLVDGVSSLGPGSMKALLIMPLVLTALSLSIMMSSYILSAVMPVGILQLFTAIAIAGVFTVLSYGLGQIFQGLSSFGFRSLILLPFLPLIFVSLSLAITASSYILGMVRPVGILQLFTAIMIAGVFAVIGFGLGKLLNGMKELKNPALAAMIAVALPILLVAIAGAITASSYLFAAIKPISFPQFLTAVGISIAFIPMAFALKFIVKAIENLSIVKVLLLPIIMVAMAYTIQLSSEIFAKVVPLSFNTLLSIVLLSITMAVVGVVLGFAFKLMGNIPLTTIINGGISMLMIAGVIMATSKILALGDYKKFPSVEWSLKTGLAILVIGGAVVALGLVAMAGGVAAIPIGIASMLALAVTIVAVGKILERGSYTTFPPYEWSKAVGLSLGVFGVATLTLGGIILGTLGLGGAALAAGSAGVLMIADTIVKAADILSRGTFTGGPKKEWAEAVAIALGAFSPIYGMMFKNRIFELFGGGGMGPEEFSKSIITLTTAIVDAGKTLSTGTFTGGPKKEWAEGVAIAIGGFSKVYQMMLVNGIAQFFGGGGIGPDEFSKAIVTISTAIRDSSFILMTGNYVGAPKKEWAEGVAIAIGGFSKVYQMLLVNGIAKFFGGGGMGPDEFSKAIVSISTAIRDSSFILMTGMYVGAPKKEWAEGVAVAIGGFSKVYQMLLVNGIAKFFGGGGMGPDEFSKAIVTISTAIRDSSFILKTGTYEGAPSKAWAEGVSIGIGGFSRVYQMLLTNGIAKLFGGGGMGPDEFSKAIVTISTAIRESSFILKSGTYEGAPSKEWAEGVSLGIGGFSQVYAMLMKNSIMKMFGGGGIGPDEFAKSIGVVSEGLLIAGNKLSGGKFVGGPTKQWAEGVSLGIGGFSQVYAMLMKNSIMKMFGGGGIGPDEFGKAIEVVSDGLLIAGEKLSQGKFVGGPTKKWSEGVAAGIAGFSSVYGMLVKNSIFEFFGASGLKPEDFTKSIEVISTGIVEASKTLSKGTYTGGPTKKWSEGIGLAIGEFSKIYDYLSGNFVTNFFRGGGIDPKAFVSAIETVAQGINAAGGKLTGPFPKGPSKDWAQGISMAFGEFSKIYDYFSGDIITNFLRGGAIDPQKFVDTIKVIGDGINVASKTIKGPFPEGPKKEWAQGISIAFGEFSKIYDYLSGDFITNFLRGGAIDPQKFVDTIKTVGEGINIAAKTIKGPFPEGPKKEWAQGVSIAFGEFSKIYDYLSGNFVTNFLRGGAIDPQKFIETIKTIGTGVNEAAMTIKGPFPQGPTKEWAQGISTAFGEFSKIYDNLSGNLIKNFFRGGQIDPTTFVKTIQTVATGINVAAGTIKGPFPEGPKKEWAQGISLAFGEFSKLYTYVSGDVIDQLFGRSAVDPEQFANAIITISEGINIASKTIKGPFPDGPSTEWAKSTALAFGEFSKMYSVVDEDVSAEDFAYAIQVIAQGINIASKEIKGPFPEGPSEEWATTTSRAFGEFSKIYDYFSGGWFSDEIDANKFANVISTVAEAINIASKTIKGPFPEGPDENWAKGISTAFGEFSKIYDYFSESWFSDEIDSDQFNNVIVTVAEAMNTAGSKIKGPFNPGPDKLWAKSIAQTFGAFSDIYDYMSGSWFTKPIDSDEFSDVIVTVAESITLAGSKLTGEYKVGPKKEWAEGIAESFGAFSKIYDYMGGGWFTKAIDPDLFSSVISKVAVAMNTASTSLKGPFTNGPSVPWADGISKTFGIFTNLYDYFSKGFVNRILRGTPDPNKFSTDIKTIALAINTAASTLKGPYTTAPTETWAEGVSRSFGVFTNLYDYFSKGFIGRFLTGSPDPTKFSQDIQTIATAINTASSTLKGPYTNPPTETWAEGVSRSFGVFTNLYDYFSNGFVNRIIRGTPDPTKFSNDVKNIAMAINTAAVSLKGPYSAPPSKDWSEDVAAAFGTFTNIYDYFNDQWFSFDIDPEKFNTTIKTIGEGINTAAMTLKGPYPIGPSTDWAEGVSLAFGAFSDIYDYLNDQWLSFNIDENDFNKTISTIANGIVAAANILGGTDKYPQGPSKPWAEGVSLAFGAFTDIYEYLNDQWFSFDIDPEKFTKTIKTIGAGINEAAKSLGGSENYPVGPSKPWAESISLSFGAFSKIYETLSGGWFTKAIDPEQFKTAIVTIAKGINEAAKVLAGPEAVKSYINGPPKEWSESIALSFGAFTQIFTALNSDSSWFSGGKDYSYYGNAIKSVGQGLVDAANLIGGSNVSYDLTKIPKKEWSESIRNTMANFIPTLKYISESGGIFKSGASKLIDNMSAIAGSIKDTSKTIGEGDYTIIPSKDWYTGIREGFDLFTATVKNLTSLDPKWNLMEDLATSVKETSEIISKGIYTTIIKKDWSANLKLAFSDFISILKNTKTIPSDKSFNQLRNISNNIVWVSKILPRGTYKFSVPNTWATSTKLLMFDFVSILKKVESVKEDSYNQLRNVANNVVWVSRVLQRGVYQNFVTTDWLARTKQVVYEFGYILESLSNISDSAFNKITMMGNSIVNTSRILGLGNYGFTVSQIWTDNVKETLSKFLDISLLTEGFTQKQEIASRRLASVVQINSQTLRKGVYTTRIPKEFNTSVIGAYKAFSGILIEIQKSGLIEKLNSELVGKSVFISQMIGEVAKFFNNANINFDNEKMPTMEWASGFASTVNSLVPGITLIDELSKEGKVDGQGLFKRNAIAITETVIEISKKFDGLKIKKNTEIPEDYFGNISKAITSYVELARTMSGGSLSGDNQKFLTGLDKMKTAYDKLADALVNINKSIKGIDIAKLEAVNSLSKSVVALSTVDIGAFERTVGSMKRESPNLNQAVSNIENKTPVSGKSEKTSEGVKINVIGKSEKVAKSETDEDMKQMMANIATALSSIVAVLGVPAAGGGQESGTTLMTALQKYIGQLKTSSMASTAGTNK